MLEDVVARRVRGRGLLHKVRRLSAPKVVLHARPRFSLQQTIYFL
jgi:hypothetical protein